ncbi:MAG TPA: Gfo/Idh/MocA family oxidoreductase [Mariniphaga sp.]|nr:Gfo/Idh/MocA family oxidoreductase [Mariniphaga sp.]
MKNLDRRKFIKNSTILTAGVGIMPHSLTVLKKGRAIGANDRIRIGIIGCGSRGNRVYMDGIHKHTEKMNVEIVAICDPWKVSREQANLKVKEWYGRDARLVSSYRDLLELDNIDAVMIASPDHLHTTHLEAAAQAGKHIYVEKPLAMDMDRLIRAVDAVKKAGVVVQVGTQLRSLPGIIGAKELISQGKLGQLSRVEECRNSQRPYWYSYLRDVKEEDVDWKEFLADRPYRPFRPDIYSAWYGYYDFSHGPIPNLGAHFIDIVHFVTGATFPESCVCLGGTFTWKDEHQFTAPDCIQATWIYPEGFLVSSSNNLGNGNGSVRNFYGDKGTLQMPNWGKPTYNDEAAPRKDGSINGEHAVTPIDTPDHFLDWLQCIRDNKTPIAPIEAGYQHAVAVLMAMKSYETGRRIGYDQKKRKLIEL